MNNVAQDSIVDRIRSRFDSIKKFETKGQRVIFWIDETGEFKDSIDGLDLDDIKILKLNGYNSFKVKYLLECEDTESRYLVYLPYPVPKDIDNILADTMHYCDPPFCADKPSLLCMDMGIPVKNVEVIRKYFKFFSNGDRRKRFQRFDVDYNDSNSIILGMMAVVLDSDSPEFNHILKNVLRLYSESVDSDDSSSVLQMMESYDLVDSFWYMCKKEYGIEDRTLGGLVRTLFISYASCKIELRKMAKVDPYTSTKGGRISTFINGLYNDADYFVTAEVLSDWVSNKMKLKEYFELYDSKTLAESDAFRCIDEIIIGRLIGQMISTCKPLDSSDVSILRKRETLHFSDIYGPHYSMIEFGLYLLQELSNFSVILSSIKSPKSLIDNYASKWYAIDRYYRGFIFNIDRINDKSRDMEQFIDFIENTYNNRFLNELSEKLCSMVRSYNDLPDPKQIDFYNKYVQKSDQATVVIISDAFRYECAAELSEDIDKSSRIKEQKLEYMISTLPSITKFGMAALLPNNGLQVYHDEEYTVKINGMDTDMDDREGVLRARNPESAVLRYKQAVSMKIAELREMCRGKRVVYIYHNAVDATGDNPQTEMNTFVACNNAIDEIKRLIEKITNGLSYTRFIITSDHGFIYRRRKIEEIDKIQLPERVFAEKRYLLSDMPCGFVQSVEMSLEYLGKMNGEFYVSVPASSGIFKVAGAGQNFVHGGMSPQEIVIPVLTVYTNKGKVTEEYVGLKASSKPVIKKSRQNIGLWQENSVSDKYREAVYDLWFEDENGHRVSDIQSVIANRVEGQEMEHRIHFTISMTKGTAYLNIKNKTDEDVPIVKEEYQVQIMFTDLGGI